MKTTTGAALAAVQQQHGDRASYTYNDAPWTITPYIQYTHVDADASLGILGRRIDDRRRRARELQDQRPLEPRRPLRNISVRTGRAWAPDLLGYGPKSSAMSFTLTPTWQNGQYFRARRGVGGAASQYHCGLGVRQGGNSTTQARGLLEGGIIF